MLVRSKRKFIALLCLSAVILILYLYMQIGNDDKYSIIEKIGSKNYKLKILPKDHLNAVRLEIDGDINMDYWREILFGLDHQLVSPTNKNVALKLIKKIFYLNDLNHDKQLDKEEIFTLISNNIKGHLKRAIEAHKEAFKMLDTKQRGSISWNDFITKYLELVDKPKAFIDKFLQNPEDNLLTDMEKEVIQNAQKRWRDADLNEDKELNDKEYLGFIHPELNEVYLERMCDKILMHLDRNNDGQLTEAEFIDSQHKHSVQIVTPYPGYIGAEDDANINSDDEISRRKEFKEQIDLNQDGIASRAELIAFINPRNVANTRRDVTEIIKLIDANSDGRLSLVELNQNYQKVINSKMVNVAAAFHDDDL